MRGVRTTRLQGGACVPIHVVFFLVFSDSGGPRITVRVANLRTERELLGIECDNPSKLTQVKPYECANGRVRRVVRKG